MNTIPNFQIHNLYYENGDKVNIKFLVLAIVTFYYISFDRNINIV